MLKLDNYKLAMPVEQFEENCPLLCELAEYLQAEGIEYTIGHRIDDDDWMMYEPAIIWNSPAHSNMRVTSYQNGDRIEYVKKSIEIKTLDDGYIQYEKTTSSKGHTKVITRKYRMIV